LKDSVTEKLKKLTEISRFIAGVTGFYLSPNHPYVGKNAFAHKGGVHIDAVLKKPRSYEHIDPSLVGNERSLSVSEYGGRAALIDLARPIRLHLGKEGLSSLSQKIKRMEDK